MTTKLVPQLALVILSAGAVSTPLLLWGQIPNPAQKQVQVETSIPAPIFRVEVVQRSTPAVNYLHRGGSTNIDFKGTALLGTGKGSAKVESERGVIRIEAKFENLVQPQTFGPEYLTYVLWAVSPDGRPVNLGELTLNDYGAGSKSEIKTASEIQTFGMIVTAEPYYAVTQPSDVVVLENAIRPDTRGVIETINARYELLPRGTYTRQGHAAGFVAVKVDKQNPFELYEAQNAVQLARVAGAGRYATESFNQAVAALNKALEYQGQKPGQKPVITMAREAAVRAEDARVVAIRRAQEEALAKERADAQAREAAERARAEEAQRNAEQARLNADYARLKAEEEARQRAKADADRQQAEAQRAQAESERLAAEQAKAEALTAAQAAEAAKQQAEQARLQADAARQAALAEQQRLAADADRARNDAEQARKAAADAEAERAKLRQQLLTQLNAILLTRDTARGLIVNMSDVLFDFGKYTLKPGAREKLAKISGIVLSHPGLKLEVEGHTDSIGSDAYNQRLSEDRANAVRSFLVSQGVASANITARGFGKTRPVASNSTDAGRQQNRRVELVVSGEILGTTVSDLRTSETSSAGPH
jgi:outer membrane protein OmpA-like peptidoglycan-associated protein